MAKIIGFHAIRPTRDKVHLVATRPYYTYKSNVLKAKLEDNPYTFLHIINPEFGKTHKTKPNSDDRFKLVKKQFYQFLSEKILIQEKQETIYLYRHTKDTFSCLGIIAGSSVEEYNNGKIKKHEATLTSREEMFTRYLEIVGFNAEPVLLTYEHDEKIAQFLNEKTQDRPEYEFTTTDQVKHELWCLNSDDSENIKKMFLNIPATYIADGHHRSASSARLHQLKNSTKEKKSTSFFLSYLVQENQVQILEFNRLVKSLNGLSKDQFCEKIREIGDLKKIKNIRKPTVEHEIIIILKDDLYSLKLRDKLLEKEHPVKSLDAEILTQFILTPILGIQDLKTSLEIEFSPGNEPIEGLVHKVQLGKFQVGFLLFPATIQQIKKVADHRMNMPPKSTWVEPKLRSGLTIYPL